MYSPEHKDFLTTGEAVAYLGISRAYFYILKRRIDIKTYAVGGGKKLLYAKDDLKALITLKN